MTNYKSSSDCRMTSQSPSEPISGSIVSIKYKASSELLSSAQPDSILVMEWNRSLCTTARTQHCIMQAILTKQIAVISVYKPLISAIHLKGDTVSPLLSAAPHSPVALLYSSARIPHSTASPRSTYPL